MDCDHQFSGYTSGQKGSPGRLAMWRHGDVLVERIDAIPVGAHPRPDLVLAYGELTGHSHRIAESGQAVLLELNGDRFLKVMGDSVTLVHEEHHPISLEKGSYRVWRQREYRPGAVPRRIAD